jgi:hypothetical protein
MRNLFIFSFIVFFTCLEAYAQNSWLTYPGGEGAGKGKHIVLISGDEEYRSEEALPLLARILSKYHGFKCTVLFAIDAETGRVNPDNQTNIPGLEVLEQADLMIMFLRFRELPDQQMKYIDAFTKSGKPIIALRTSTHAFRYTRNLKSPFAHYSFDSKVKGWIGGYGQQILGETWVAHHGKHGEEGTRGLNNGLFESHPILKGVKDIWAPTDVYTVVNLPADAQVLVFGQTTKGMNSEAPLSYEKSIMPVAWIREYTSSNGKKSRIFTTTMGASVDLLNEDLRRLIVNAAYWGLQMENKIPDRSNVSIEGPYKPSMFSFGGYKKGLLPSDF